tara:strand:- start:11151 stop:11354 length:204 start_codon:yes stop_codon:yes gene_type:complete
MGRMKELAIKQAEENLEYLYEKYYIEAALIQAEQREEAERILHQEMLLDEQVNQDRNENRKTRKEKD